MDFRNEKIGIIGAARSGLASALALKRLGAKPFLSELKPAEKFAEAAAALKANGIEHEFGGHTNRLFGSELLIISPGVPANSEVVKRALERDLKIITELELGFQLCRGKTLAITGSNGKTTTTSLIGEIFRHSNVKGVVAGNIGRPFVSVAGDIGEKDWAILEVSTFQLEWIDTFKPKVAAVLNITPDHLDRHGTMENYIELKLKVFANQNGTDKSVINADDRYLKKFTNVSETFRFSTSEKIEQGCFIDRDIVYLRQHGDSVPIINIAEIGIKGPHNLSNACAAAACCAAAGIDNAAIATGLKAFKGVEHRLEPVRLIGGVSFINDSKATNVDAVYWALRSVLYPVILIAGGRDKQGDFGSLRELVRSRVKDIVLIGEAAPKIAAAFKDITAIHDAGSMADAIDQAYALAKPGGTVLLSPGCASFDMFDNFEHRGKVFKEAVMQLKENRP